MNSRELVKKLFGKSISGMEDLQKDGVEEFHRLLVNEIDGLKSLDKTRKLLKSYRDDFAEEAARTMMSRLSNADILIYEEEYEYLIDVDIEPDLSVDIPICARTVLRYAIVKVIKDHILEVTNGEN